MFALHLDPALRQQLFLQMLSVTGAPVRQAPALSDWALAVDTSLAGALSKLPLHVAQALLGDLAGQIALWLQSCP